MDDKKEKKKEPKSLALLEDVTLELKPADLAKEFKRAFQLALEMAENKEYHLVDRLNSLKMMDIMYTTVTMKDGLDESVSKMARAQNRTTDEVRRLRKKDWEDEPED